MKYWDSLSEMKSKINFEDQPAAYSHLCAFLPNLVVNVIQSLSLAVSHPTCCLREGPEHKPACPESFSELLFYWEITHTPDSFPILSI